MKISVLQFDHYTLLSQFYIENFEHFKLWSPKFTISDHSVEAWEARIADLMKLQREGRSVYFVGIESGQIVARSSLTEIVRGAFQACYLGFGVSKSCEGQGKAYQIADHSISYAFKELGLHRIMAGYMPHNNRSATLLKKLGFEIEGFARNYLKIGGKWENSFLTSLTNPYSL